MERPITRACSDGIKIARQALKNKGLSQNMLAKKLDIGSSTVNAFFKGKAVTDGNFNAICEYLEHDRNEIAGIPDVSKQVIEQPVTQNDSSSEKTSIDELVKTAREKIRAYIEVSRGAMLSSEPTKIVFNIIVTGKTGAGKSSLINYLFDKHILENSVTQAITNWFQIYNTTWNSIPVNIYDFMDEKFLEAVDGGKRIDYELKKYSRKFQVGEYFNTVLYCINAANNRIKPFEFNIIKDLIINKYRVIVVLTHADLESKDTIFELYKYILENVSLEIPIIDVCSVEKKMRDHSVTHPFGKDALINEIFGGN